MQTTPISALTVARWLAGPLVWTAHFFIVYAAESLICSRGGGATAHLLLVAAATIAGLLVLLAVTAYSWRMASEQDAAAPAFMDKVAAGLGLLGVLGMIWTALPATMLSSCQPPS